MLKKLSPYHYALLSKRLGEYHYTRLKNGSYPLREGEPALDRWIEHLNLTHDETPIHRVSDLLRETEQSTSWEDEGTESGVIKDPMIFMIRRLMERQHAIDWQAYVDFYHDLTPTDQAQIDTVFTELMGFDHADFLNPRDPVWTVPEQVNDLSKSSVSILLNTEQRAQRIHETLKYRVKLESFFYERDDEGQWLEAGEHHLVGVAATLEGAIEIAAKGIEKFVLVRSADELNPTAMDAEVISGICGSPVRLYIADWSNNEVWPVYIPLSANVREHLVHNAGDQHTFHLSLDWKMPFDELELPVAMAEIEALEQRLAGESGEASQDRLEELRSRIPAAGDDALQYKQTLIETLSKVRPDGRSQFLEHDLGR